MKTLLALVPLLLPGWLLAGCSSPSTAPPTLDHSLEAVAFLVGEWDVRERTFGPDGTLASELEGGRVRCEPVLAGDWLMLTTGPPPDVAEPEALLWLFTRDAETGALVAQGFSSGAATVVTATGSLEDGVLELAGVPASTPDGEDWKFRVRIEPRTEQVVRVILELDLGEGWVRRGEETWTRRRTSLPHGQLA